MIRVLAGVTLATVLLSAAPAKAADWRERFRAEPGVDKFSARERTWDLFGSWNVRDNQNFFEGRIGIGLGINYFFTEYFGVGADTRFEAFDWPNHVNGSAIARYPVGQSKNWAPYGFGGFGRQFHNTTQWTGHFGGGVDYRLNYSTGLFMDVRRTLTEKTQDATLLRFGVRMKF